MAAVSFEVNQLHLEAIHRKLAALMSVDNNEIIDSVGAIIESQTKRRIEEAGGGFSPALTDLGTWAQWSEDYADTRHINQRLLRGNDDLLQSIQYFEDKKAVGSPLVYAAIHQFGGEEIGRKLASH